MRIAMISSECEPYAKTGGLADVVDALARALGQQGHPVDVYLPRYRGLELPDGAREASLRVPTGSDGSSTTVTIMTAPGDGYRLRLIGHPASFDRPAYYGGPDGDYPDNGARFALLGRAALEQIRADGEPVDVIHGHDWQSGPALLLLHHAYRSDPVLGRAASMLTCHNLAYHGWVPRAHAAALGLPSAVGKDDGVDLLREAIAIADIVNTVSPTYAEESKTDQFGAGLDDVLSARGDTYIGIINGIDSQLWDPATDVALPAAYSIEDVSGKSACKTALMERLKLIGASPGEGWDARGAPLFGLIGRLDPQKGFDLLAGAAGDLLSMGVRIAVLGSGDHRLIEGLQAQALGREDRLSVTERFDRHLARQIYAGVDVFLMPSRFEPCGQGQMIALRYGSIPLVRSTGGLADTIMDEDEDPVRGNGFTFLSATPAALVEAAERTLAAYRDQDRWDALQRRGMAEDFSWAAPARQYVAAYERARSMPRTSPVS
ncbi:MAG: glycogen synthase [Chloroflexi bacterium]|nr:glycogen synthase [Chloroflexota bacterium]